MWVSTSPSSWVLKVLCSFSVISPLQDPIQAERRVFTNFHRQVFCWLDQWHGLSLRDIRRIEAQTKIELDEVSPYSLPLLSPLLFYYIETQLYSYMCVQCMQLCASAAYTVLLCWHCCRKRYRDAFSTAVKILPITELHLGPAHTQVIELKFIITLARENS